MSETKKLVESIQNKINEGVDWNYFDRFNSIADKYMADRGEGENKASQIVTAINKLVYKWYNDGDVFDNTHYLDGWANDLSSYANWLYANADGADAILSKIEDCKTDDQYELLLKELADEFLVEDVLSHFEQEAKTGSIYECNGPFEFREEPYYDEEDEYYDDDEEDYED